MKRRTKKYRKARNVSPVGERSCVKGNSKFTGGVFAEADEKFRENNDEIKRRNVCTQVSRQPWAVVLPSRTRTRTFPNEPAFMHCTTSEC